MAYPGVAELLKRLRARDVRLALCTNKSGRVTGGMLAALGVGGAFDAVVSGDELPIASRTRGTCSTRSAARAARRR